MSNRSKPKGLELIFSPNSLNYAHSLSPRWGLSDRLPVVDASGVHL